MMIGNIPHKRRRKRVNLEPLKLMGIDHPLPKNPLREDPDDRTAYQIAVAADTDKRHFRLIDFDVIVHNEAFGSFSVYDATTGDLMYIWDAPTGLGLAKIDTLVDNNRIDEAYQYLAGSIDTVLAWQMRCGLVAKIWLGYLALDLMLDEYVIELLSAMTLT
jgi:hypothetical protein